MNKILLTDLIDEASIRGSGGRGQVVVNLEPSVSPVGRLTQDVDTLIVRRATLSLLGVEVPPAKPACGFVRRRLKRGCFPAIGGQLFFQGFLLKCSSL